jgi:hypothetical protein
VADVSDVAGVGDVAAVCEVSAVGVLTSLLQRKPCKLKTA